MLILDIGARPIRVTYTYEVATEYPPQRGDSYQDRSTHAEWVVAEVVTAPPAIRNPPATKPLYEVTLRSPWGAPAVPMRLIAMYEQALGGYLQRTPTGSVLGLGELPGLAHSWMFRENINANGEREFALFVGPRVGSFVEFCGSLIEYKTPWEDRDSLPWWFVEQSQSQFRKDFHE